MYTLSQPPENLLELFLKPSGEGAEADPDWTLKRKKKKKLCETMINTRNTKMIKMKM